MNRIVYSAAILSLTVALQTAAWAQSSVGGPQVFRPQERIELGNGYFQFVLDPAVGTETPTWLDGALEWEYAGQAVYTEDAGRVLRVPVPIVPDHGPNDRVSRLLASQMEDEHGRRFVVKRVDVERLERAISAYDAKIAMEFGQVEEVGPPDDGRHTDPAPVTGYAWPHTWYRVDVDGDGDAEEFKWCADDRELIEDPLTSRQQKVVLYFGGGPGDDGNSWDCSGDTVGDYNWGCSGVLVGDHWVLTAAHCAMNSAGTAWIYPRGEVCTRGAGRYSGWNCATVTARWGTENYSGDGDFAWDLVILRIDEDLGEGNYMALSQASDSVLKDHPAYNIGYPSWTLGNDWNRDNCFMSGLTRAYEAWMYWSSDEVTHTSTRIIGGRMDSAVGHSGGPIFYYPDGVGDDSRHYLTGIMAGHHEGVETYNGGPKIPYHRDWILSIID